jgi:hypothetical protein
MGIRTKINLRGLKDIRTRSGRVDRVGVPYMAYMKISCLEMERARRETEKSSAQIRIRNIDARLADIEAEKDATLKCLGEREPGVDQKRSKPKGISVQTARRDDRGFKIRY